MNAPMHVVSLGSAPDVVQQIERACGTEPDLRFIGAAQMPTRLLSYRPPPEVVLIGGTAVSTEWLRLIEETTMLLPLASVIVLTSGERMDLVQRALLAGARGFLPQPFSNQELHESIRRIRGLEVQKQARLTEGTAEETVSRQGRILAVFSPKGGVGRTTISSNLAVALQQMHKQVVLVDGSLQFGDLPVVLNILQNHATVVSLVRVLEEIDRELLMEALIPHSSGVRLLLAPSHLEEADAVHPEAIQRIMGALQQHFDYVIVDTWAFLDHTNLAILDAAARILMVGTPELPALREIRLFLELADARNYPSSKLLFILNRATSVFGIRPADIEEHIRYRIAVNIPSDDALVTRSLNRGVPFVISDPQSPVSRSIRQLAELLVDGGDTPGAGRRGQSGDARASSRMITS